MSYKKVIKSMSALFLLGITMFELVSCGTKTSLKKSSTLKEEPVKKEEVQQVSKKSLTTPQEEKPATTGKASPTSQEGNLVISEKLSISTKEKSIAIEKTFTKEDKAVKLAATSKKNQLSQAGYNLLCRSFDKKAMETSKQEIRLYKIVAEINELSRFMERNGGDALTPGEFDVFVAVFHGLKNEWWQKATFVKVLCDPSLDPQTKRKLSASLLFLFVMDSVNGKFVPGLAKRKLAELNILVASIIANNTSALVGKKATVHNAGKNLTEQLGIDPEKFPSHKDNLQLADKRWREFINQNKQMVKEGQGNLLKEAEKMYQSYWRNVNSTTGSKPWKVK